MGEWRKVKTKEGAIDAKEEIIDSNIYNRVLLVWWTPPPSDSFIEEAKDRSTVTDWRAGIWIKESIELPEKLRKEDYGAGSNHCAVMLDLESNKVVEKFEPNDDRKIDPAFLKPDC